MSEQMASHGSDDSAAVGLGDAGYDEAANQKDQGVTVGSADVEADAQRASGDHERQDGDEYLDEVRAEEATDQGVPVGQADVDEDRRNAEQRSDR